MTMNRKMLDRTLIYLLFGTASLAPAQPRSETPSAIAPESVCQSGGCDGPERPDLIGRSNPRQTSTAAGMVPPQPTGQETAPALVGAAYGVGQEHNALALSAGGVIWATEDPTLGQAELTVSAPRQAPFDGKQVTRPLTFYVRSNYSAFVHSYQLILYDARDTDLVHPLVELPVRVNNVAQVIWDGQLPTNVRHRVGDDLLYLIKAYGATGEYDQTAPRRLQLVRPDEFERNNQIIQASMEKTLGKRLTLEQGETERLLEDVFSTNGLLRQNIALYGSRVRIQGRNLPADTRLTINDESYPLDTQRKFTAEYLLPIGQHHFDLAIKTQDNANGVDETGQADRLIHHVIDIDVTGQYFFGIGLADLTVGQNKISGSIEPFKVNSQYKDDIISDGRLAFYTKAKLHGKYLVTAQADTSEKELKYLFKDFGKSDPYDVFRSLDPSLYYPTYGDDSTIRRDVDTQGRFYLRTNWDKNEAIWGNFATGLTGTEFSQYVRALYGGAFNWRSRSTNPWGEEKTLLRLFASQPNSVKGHDELLGTGGSLYYLKHADILAGSENVLLEIIDPTTGRVQQQIPLIRGTDYEINQIQGRLLLTRPLMQLTHDHVFTLTRDLPLNGLQQRLVIDYEYAPVGFDSDELTIGLRAKQWLGDHVALGATSVREGRAGQDYTLEGADFILRSGRGTYIKVEHTHTQSLSVPSFYSDNGGLRFFQINPTGPRQGNADAVEARLNLRENGWSSLDWTVASWWRHVDPGYSTSYTDMGQRMLEYGVDVFGYVTPDWTVYGRYSQADKGVQGFSQGQLTSQWHLSEWDLLSAEIRRVKDSVKTQQPAVGWLSAVRYTHQWSNASQLYGQAQVTLNQHNHGYAKNDALTLGGSYALTQSTAIGGEYTVGSRGQATQINAEYQVSPGHSFYGLMTSGNYQKDYDPVFANSLQQGWTIGQRWQISHQINIYNESQFLKPDMALSSGLAHTFGLDYYPMPGWVTGFTLQNGRLENLLAGEVKRRAVSVNGGRNAAQTDWQSKVEWRRDTGAENRDQWVMTNRLTHRFNESFRVAARVNYAKTHDHLVTLLGAKFIEGNLGFAWRPWNSTRWGFFGRYTYLFDLASLTQLGGAQHDQRSQILSFEGVYRLNPAWELGEKWARRQGDLRRQRGRGPWFNSNASFAAVQARYALMRQWYVLGEFRRLSARQGGVKNGWMIDLDRDLTRNLRLGLGYNFSRFSDDLTDFDYNHRGFFINFLGSY